MKGPLGPPRKAEPDESDRGAAEWLMRLTKPKTKIPHLEAFLEECIESMGGVRGLGQRMRSEFQNARPGSALRIKILDMICRMATVAHKEKISSDEGNYVAMEDGDLQNALMDQLDGVPGMEGVVDAMREPHEGEPPEYDNELEDEFEGEDVGN